MERRIAETSYRPGKKSHKAGIKPTTVHQEVSGKDRYTYEQLRSKLDPIYEDIEGGFLKNKQMQVLICRALTHVPAEILDRVLDRSLVVGVMEECIVTLYSLKHKETGRHVRVVIKKAFDWKSTDSKLSIPRGFLSGHRKDELDRTILLLIAHTWLRETTLDYSPPELGASKAEWEKYIEVLWGIEKEARIMVNEWGEGAED